MPSKNTGKVITKININKKNVSLYFGKERLPISFDTYVNEGPLYVGKELSEKEYSKIKGFEDVATLYKYAITLLSKNSYSEWKVREKLYKKEVKKEDVDVIINKLKNAGLIDDSIYMKELLEYYNDRNFGKNKIIQELNKKGIFIQDIQTIKFTYKEEYKKALSQLPKLEKKYDKYSYSQKKSHIFAALSALGFENEIINQVMEKISPKVEKDEYKKLKSDYQKTSIRLKKKYKGKELKEKIIQSLTLKGYRFGDILKVMEAN